MASPEKKETKERTPSSLQETIYSRPRTDLSEQDYSKLLQQAYLLPQTEAAAPATSHHSFSSSHASSSTVAPATASASSVLPSSAQDIPSFLETLKQRVKPYPEVLIEAISTQNVELIIALTRLHNVRAWLHTPDAQGKTAAYYALTYFNPEIFKHLFNCGLDPEQPIYFKTNAQTKAIKPLGLLSLSYNNPQLFPECHKLLLDHYRTGEQCIEGQTLTMWQQWRLEDQPKHQPSPLLEAVEAGDTMAINKLLAEAKKDSIPVICDRNGDNAFTLAAKSGKVDIILQLIEGGMDARTTPQLFNIMRDWSKKAGQGEEFEARIKECLRLVTALQTVYGEEAMFQPATLAFWQLKFEECQHVYKKNILYYDLLQTEHSPAEVHIKSGSDFLCDPKFFTLPWRNENPEGGKLPFFVSVIADLREPPHPKPRSRAWLSAIIDKLTPRHINLLIRREPSADHPEDSYVSVLEYLLEALILAPAEMLGPDLEKAIWDKIKTLLPYGVNLNAEKLWATCKSALPQKRFELAYILQLANLDLFKLEKFPASLLFLSLKSHPNHKEYLIKILKTMPTFPAEHLSIPYVIPEDFPDQEDLPAGTKTVIHASLAGILVFYGYADLITIFLDKGWIDLSQQHIFFNALPIGAQETPSLLLWHAVRLNYAPRNIIRFLKEGANPQGIAYYLANPPSANTLRSIKLFLSILIEGLNKNSINRPLQGRTLAHWLTLHSKNFNWPEDKLKPLLIRMLQNNVDFDMLLREAQTQKHFVLIELLIPLLIENLNQKELNTSLQGRTLAYWLTFYGKNFNWPEDKLRPLVSKMIQNKVACAALLEEARTQEYILLFELLDELAPKTIEGLPSATGLFSKKRTDIELLPPPPPPSAPVAVSIIPRSPPRGESSGASPSPSG